MTVQLGACTVGGRGGEERGRRGKKGRVEGVQVVVDWGEKTDESSGVCEANARCRVLTSRDDRVWYHAHVVSR